MGEQNLLGTCCSDTSCCNLYHIRLATEATINNKSNTLTCTHLEKEITQSLRDSAQIIYIPRSRYIPLYEKKIKNTQNHTPIQALRSKVVGPSLTMGTHDIFHLTKSNAIRNFFQTMWILLFHRIINPHIYSICEF